MKQHIPVVIIGCGPAGASTSLFLSKAGIQHIILEKDTFPRDKICGDGCSGKTALVLRRANPQYLEEIFNNKEHFLPSYGVTFAAPNGKSIPIPFALDKNELQYPPGFTSRRIDFDQFLFSKLPGPYVTIEQAVHITDIEKIENGYSVTYKSGTEEKTITCSLLVGADGDKGITRKKLLQQDKVSKTVSIGLRAYYEGVTGMHEDNFIELHFLQEALPGYFWIFPLPNGMANIGVGIDAAVVRKKKLNLREIMLKAINENPNIKSRFAGAKLTGKIYGWGLPTATGKVKVSGDHFLLTGDAASLIDPFTGEGIGNALYSGMLAADAAIKALQENRFDERFLQEHYGDVLFRCIGGELKLSYTLQRMVRYPWLFNFLMNKAYKSPSLRNTLSSMFANLDAREMLRKPSFYWKVLMNK